MPIEIERKFLVCGDEWRSDATGPHRIVQGYFCRNDRLIGRVRLMGDRGYLAVKERKTGISRMEFEYEIPRDDAEEMILLFCRDAIIHKDRYIVEFHRKIWYVDVFSEDNSGIIFAEVELECPDERIHLPDWVGDEVTTVPRYGNSNLANKPFAEWQDDGPSQKCA